VLFLACSKKVETAIGLGLAVVFVQVLTVPLNNLLLNYLLAEGALAWLHPSLAKVDLTFLAFILFIATIAAATQVVEMAVERYAPELYTTLGVFLPLIAVNCVILGGSLFMQERSLQPARKRGLRHRLGRRLCHRHHRAGRDSREARVLQRARRPARPGHHLHHHRADVDGLHGVFGHPALGTHMLSIGLAVVMFTVVVLMLVALLMVARRKMVPSGDVAITVNEDSTKVMKVAAGGTLLGALTDHKIFIPSACGGKGTCGVCEVIVKEGGGTILPTETGFISRKEAKHGCRLACQVKVKRDMRIEVPAEIFSVRKWNCKVLSNRNVSTFIKELKVELPARRGSALPRRRLRADLLPAARAEPTRTSTSRAVPRRVGQVRPLALQVGGDRAGRARLFGGQLPAGKGCAAVHHPHRLPARLRDEIPPGKMSSYLFNLKPGDTVTVAGPFGEFFARDTDKEMCFVAAGAGMAPMRSHIFDQLLRLKSNAQDELLVLGAQPVRSLLRRRVQQAAGRAPQLQVAHRAVRTAARRQLDRAGGPGAAQGLARPVPGQAPGARGHRVLPVRPRCDEQGRHRMCMEMGVDRENIMLDDFGL
jgi:Na+-transporting NADH:ubiquinone oxidoreductase subunit F